MPAELPDGAPAAVAYQRLRLWEMRDLYEELDLDLEHYLGVEKGVSERIDSAWEEAAKIRKAFSSLGVDVDDIESHGTHEGIASDQIGQGKIYRRIAPGESDGFRSLVEEAEAYLAEAGVDLEKDPLLQVLGSSEVAGTAAAYRKKYGDIGWDRSDYLIVVLAGLVATLLDIFLVRIPGDTRFLGRMQSGSPLTEWLKEHSAEVHEYVLKRFESAANVPYDESLNKVVAGLSPKTHRLMSLGHDPVLGFIFGVADILGNTGTFIDQHGDIVRVAKAPLDPVDLTAAFLKVFLHLLSDVCTSAGIQPPFFTLLQLVKVRSPFVLGLSGEAVPWTDVARYMYVHGYDLRHFATMGIVPAAIEMVVRGWRLCESYAREEDPELTRAKTASMLMLAHTIATSGNLLKTGAIYGMNPLAMNWAQMLWMFPVTVSWVRESVRRDARIRSGLDAEWADLYDAVQTELEGD